MQGNLSPYAQRPSSLSLGSNHGYRFEGDLAILNAELALSDVDSSSFDGAREQPEQQWALQLWACETPYQGGPLHGLKVAEAELALPSYRDEPTRLETTAFARLPPTHGEYAMVLVLASGDRGRYDQVHDFSNYAERQQFAGPRLDGSVGYRIEGAEVVLQAEGVRNSRDADNLSGTLALELWALNGSYQGGPLYGQLLAQATLGCLEGQNEQRFIEQRVQLTDASPGTWDVALVLREWTSAEGYITRDYCNFSAPHVVSSREPASTVSSDFVDAWQTEPAYVDQDSQAESTPAQPVAEAAPVVEAAPREPESAPSPVVISKAVTIETPVEPVSSEPVEAKPAAKASDAKYALQAKPVQAKPVQAAPAKTAAQPAAAQPVKAAATVAAPAKPTPVAASAPSEPKPSKPRVSLQTATVEELASVDGLNKKLAQAIVKARPFAALEDVVKVRGIGDKMLQHLRERLTL